MDLKLKVRDYIARFVENGKFEDGDDIFEQGLVNSLFAMQLVMFVEKEFDVNAGGSDMNIRNFRSIDAIADFVNRKKAETLV